MASLENTTVIDVHPLYPPLLVQFSLLLVISVASLPSFAFVLYHLLTTRALYTALNNHVIILLLISNGLQTLTDVPVQLAYFYRGIIWPPSARYCIFYYFIDFDLFTTCFLLITWASFERHILIFHSRWYNTRTRRLLGHYLPLGFCCLYPPVYYFVFLVLYPCENTYDESIANCATPCYLATSQIMALYEQFVQGFALIFLIFAVNVALVLRILHQKRRMNQQLTWAKNLKMMIQLHGICCLFFVTNGGYFVIQLVRLLWNPDFGVDAYAWIYPFSLWMPPCIAFVCLGTLKDVRVSLMRIFSWHRRRTMVVPTQWTQTQTR